MKSSNLVFLLELGTATTMQNVAIRMSPAGDNARTLIP
jgi:hypothetical protein